MAEPIISDLALVKKTKFARNFGLKGQIQDANNPAERTLTLFEGFLTERYVACGFIPTSGGTGHVEFPEGNSIPPGDL
jgi:hypothetical protein